MPLIWVVTGTEAGFFSYLHCNTSSDSDVLLLSSTWYARYPGTRFISAPAFASRLPLLSTLKRTSERES